MSQNIVEVSKAEVKSIYEGSEDPSLFYHSWEHTDRVCTAVLSISENTPDVSDSNKEALAIAAIFHDVAYTSGSEQHELDSADLAKKFLLEKEYDVSQIELINRLIMATKMCHEPSDLLEQIMQDADLAHLGNMDYMNTTYEDLYKEIKAKYQPDMTLDQWAIKCSEFMHKHEFHTAHARKQYGPQKIINLAAIDALVKTISDKGIASDQPVKSKKKSKKKKNKNKGKGKSDLPEKGVETMFRVALRNHINLSRIADNKANTLISVNAIIISIVLSTLFPKMDSNPFLIYPGLCLMVFSIITIIISILSTIPKTTHGRVSRKEVEEKKGNLIFFGNFHKMPLEDFEWGIKELMKDRDYLYKTLTRDLYFLGKVLNRKYNLLRYSYYTFVIGLLLTIVLFTISLRGFF